MKKTAIISFIIAFLTTSCFYVDADQHYVSVVSDYNPAITITTNLDGQDSIVLNDSLLFMYEVSIDTGKLYAVNMYFDELLIYSKDTLRDSIWIDPYYLLYDGEYELTIVAFFKSYTGSLADLYDADLSLRADTSWNILLKRTVEQ